MIRQSSVVFMLLLGIAGTTSAQNRKRSVQEEREVIHRHAGVIDPHKFYNTPYRSRNSGCYGFDYSLLSFGFGFPNTLRYDVNNRSGAVSSVGPFMAKFERSVHDEIGIGVVVDAAYAQTRYNLGSRTYRDKAFGIGASFLGYYHFNKLIPVRKLDVYAGAGINIGHVSYTSTYTDFGTSDVNVLPAFVVGARYYVRTNLAPYLELGRTNYSYVNTGISIRL